MSEHKDCFEYEVRDGKLRGFQYTSPDGGWPKPAQKAGQPLAAQKAKGSPPLPAQDAKGSLAVGGSSPAKETHLDSSTAFGNSQPLAAPSAPMAAASSSEPSPPLAPPEKAIADWSVADVVKYVKYLELSHLENLVVEQGVDGLTLLELEPSELEMMGMTKWQALKVKKRLPKST